MKPIPVTPEARVLHAWNDPDGDGHNCADCSADSMWKCDADAHMRGAFDLLTAEQQADLDRALSEDQNTRRAARFEAGKMRLP